MPAFIIAWVLKFVSAETIKAVVGFVFSPLGAVCLIALAFGGGDLWGRHKSNVYWRAENARMVERAKTIDVKAAQRAQKMAEEDAAAAKTRADRDEERIKAYDEKLRAKADQTGCTIDDDDLVELGAGGVRLPSDASRAGGAKPAGNR